MFPFWAWFSMESFQLNGVSKFKRRHLLQANQKDGKCRWERNIQPEAKGKFCNTRASFRKSTKWIAILKKRFHSFTSAQLKVQFWSLRLLWFVRVVYEVWHAFFSKVNHLVISESWLLFCFTKLSLAYRYHPFYYE